MKIKKIINTVACLFITLSLTQPVLATVLTKSVINVVDTNPNTAIFEADLSADEQDVMIDGTTVHAFIYKDDNRVGGYPAVEANGIPIPQIVVNVGDVVIVKLTNNIAANCFQVACDSSIHWHGIELDGDSDGTGVTQNHLTEGEDYTYRFFAHRPGVFWFHTHMIPGPQTFAGMYGAFIVRDPNETSLQTNGNIPSAANTHTVVLSDTEFDASGNIGYLNGGAVAIPWATLNAGCEAGVSADCQAVKDGQTVLINGTDDVPMITARSGAGIRLRLLNVATNRYFRLSVTGNGADNNLYRIGGEGGFLDKVRLEGGILDMWDTKYTKGEIVISSSQRADVVIVPTGNQDEIITISGLAYNRGGPSNNNPAGDLLLIKIDNTLVDVPFAIAEGDDVLGAGGVDNLKALVITDFYSDPIPLFPGHPGSGVGSADETITLNSTGGAGSLTIDSVEGHFEDSGPDFTQVPFQGATRYALTGDVLELTLQNDTMLHHPFHHHGFSFQPVRVIDDTSGMTLYTFDYQEFVDVIDLFDNQSIVVRMRLEDRPRITDTRQEAGAPMPNQLFPSGGAAGRWVFHCHLFLHASIGMISELVVLDTDRDGDGFDTSVDCDDFDPNVFPGTVGCGPAPIPTLGTWSMIILTILLLMMFSIARVARRQA